MMLPTVSLVFAASVNAIINGDFSISDGMDRPAGWSRRVEVGSTVEAANRAPGTGEVTFRGAEHSYLQQGPIGLQSGGEYRLAAEVRTAGLAGAKLRLIVHDHHWRRDRHTELFPDDTKGGWQRIEWKGLVPEQDHPEDYVVAIAGNGGSNGVARAEIRNLVLEPLTSAAAEAVVRLPPKMLEPLVTRIVPIDPLLAKVPAADAAMTFYWPGEPDCGVTSCRLSGRVDGAAAVDAKLGADGRARLRFGRLKVGEHRVALSVNAPDGRVLATNAYRIVACRKPPQGPSGRRLNNFVTELVNAPLKLGTVRFFRPTDGWVWISFEGAPDSARGHLDGCAIAAVRKREGERLVETMRYVEAGNHRLEIRGGEGGRLRIHAVGNITQPMWLMTEGPCDFSRTEYRFTSGFSRRFLIPSMNTAIGCTLYVSDRRYFEPAYYAERGVRLLPGASLPFDVPRADVDEVCRRLTDGVWKLGHDTSIDENAIGCGRREHVVMSEALWRMVDERPHQLIGVYWGDATRCWFDDPKVHTAELSAIANSGDGRGLSLPEVYTPALRTREEAEPWLDLYAKQVKSLGELVPGGKACTLFNMSPYVDIGHWSDAPCPETDIKALYAWQMQAFATRPEFAANSGIGGGARTRGEEELRRWHARCLRYYAIEGGTEDLAEKYGYRWTPGFVKNCDFADGLKGWTAKAAPNGAIAPETIKFYGRRAQARQKVPAGLGDTVAMFTAAASGANRLSQRLTGLKPGTCYALMFCTAERGNAETQTAEKPEDAFCARLDGAVEIPGLTYVHRVTTKARGADPKVHNYLQIRRYVFRAERSDATLVFEDRDADGHAVPPGTRQVLNYVVFRPYYSETPDEAEEIGRLCSGN